MFRSSKKVLLDKTQLFLPLSSTNVHESVNMFYDEVYFVIFA